MNFRSRFPIWLWMISCERVDFVLRRRRCFCAVHRGKCWDPTMSWNQSSPNKHQWGVRRNSACPRPEDQPDIQQIYIERLGKRRQLISTNVCALPYPSREVMRELFSCAGVLASIAAYCSLIVFVWGWWLNTFFDKLITNLSWAHFFWGGMILIVAWLLLFTFFNYIYYLHILCIYVYIVMWYVCL